MENSNGRTIICDMPDCGEPTQHAVRLGKTGKWVCAACMSKIKARATSSKLRARSDRVQSAEIRAASRNDDSGAGSKFSTLG